MDCYLLEINESINHEDILKYINLLFEWVNDSAVRRNAFNTKKIDYREHTEWFNKMLKDNNTRQYILYKGNQPIGQIRLNINGNTALIDYSISPVFRGHRFGRYILDLAAKKVTDEIPVISKLTGLVKYENIASAKTFENCGYRRKNKENYIEFSLDL